MINFDDYIKSFDFITNTQSLIAYIVDKNSTMLRVSNGFLAEFNVDNELRSIIGRKYKQINNKKVDFFSKYEKNLFEGDELVIKSHSHHVFLQVINGEIYSKLYIVHKYPILIDNNIIIYTYMRPYGFPRIPDLTFLSFDVNLYAQPLSSDYKLTAKQLLILFFLIRNHSYTEISIWMSAFGYPISPNRVNEHISNLKSIFNVNSREELITKSLNSGYYSEIPIGLLKEGCYLIDDYLFKLNIITDFSVLNNEPEFINIASQVKENILLPDKLAEPESNLNHYLNLSRMFYLQIDEAFAIFDSSWQIVSTSFYFNQLQVSLQENSLLNAISPILHSNSNRFLLVIEAGEQKKIFIINKSSIINLGKVIGFIVSIRPYIMPSIPKIMENIFRVVKLPQILINEKKLLTQKQYFILYFYIRNYWSQKISEVLTSLGFKVTTNTVNKHLGNIKKTLNVNNKSQLMDKALVICYHGIPDVLLKTGVFDSQNTLVDKWIC
ncbi:MAG: hypothetical protein PHC75_00110 [Burkholderiales bacterium]|nr:hypothetical protein [Burkholderiales bacterium]